MRVLLAIPFCPYDGRRVSLWYLSAVCRYTTRHLFIDTFYLIALAHPRDQWHERVLTFSRSLRDYRLYTVDEVLAEFLTACSAF